MNIFDGEEVSLETALDKAQSFIGPKNIIHDVNRSPFFNDEPKLPHFLAVMNDNSRLTSGGHVDKFLGGTAFNPDKAKIKSFGEAIERYCLSIYRLGLLKRSSFLEIGKNALNPHEVSTAPVFRNSIKNESIFYWLKAWNPHMHTSDWVPAQLIFVPYSRYREPIIRIPITTGAACGTSFAAAVYRGLCECIERDAFMITYLNSLPRAKIDIADLGEEFTLISEMFSRYRLKLYVFDISTDIRVTTILTIILDKTNIGPAVSLGVKSSLDPLDAIRGSIEEAQQTRPWMRKEASQSGLRRISPNEITDFTKRGLYWYASSMSKHLDFLLKSKSVHQGFVSKPLRSMNGRLRFVLNELNRINLSTYIVDVTQNNVREQGFRVVKSIIPGLQPLYLDERFKYSEGERLKEIPKYLGFEYRKHMNPIPHPFL